MRATAAYLAAWWVIALAAPGLAAPGLASPGLAAPGLAPSPPALGAARPTASPPAASASWLPRDKDGWTVFTPARDTRVLYVSSTAGDDATGFAYPAGHRSVGPDPFQPAGPIKPFKTIAAALAQAREGMPDWVLLHRGETWLEAIRGGRSGKSATEPALIGAYGQGERPLLKTGQAGQAIALNQRGFHDLAIVSLDCYAQTRDRASKDYVSEKGGAGIGFVVSAGREVQRLLVEDCCFRFGAIVFQAPQGGVAHGIVVRRNLILDNYSSGGHSQGMFLHNVSMALEENIFDHDGWLIQSAGNRIGEGGATMFNHDTYVSECSDMVFRGNMFLRASSMGNKWRCDVTGGSRNILIDDNLYVEGEIGLGIGGNTDEPFRFVNVTVTNNVMLDIGRAQPTKRTLGWYLEISDWDGGLVAGNLLLHAVTPQVGNVYGIHLGGKSGRKIVIRDNLIQGFALGQGLIIEGDGKQDVSLVRNTVQFPDHPVPIVRASGSLKGLSFADNTYYSDAAKSSWFSLDRTGLSLAEWTKQTGERNGQARKLDFPDPSRTVESYNQSLGGKATLDDFIANVRKQAKTHWKPQYTAAAVNQYIRKGFDWTKVSVPGAPATRPGGR